MFFAREAYEKGSSEEAVTELEEDGEETENLQGRS